MFDFIIIILIIFFAIKKSGTIEQNKVKVTLEKKGFNKLILVRTNAYSFWYTAIYHGDNYLIEIMKPGNVVSKITITNLIEYATKTHYHNMILIPGNAKILNNAKELITSYNINIWDNNILYDSVNDSSASIVQKMPLDDNCIIDDDPYDPIQDGDKINSFFGSLFNKNKIDRL